jgi:hypothetical protein
MGVFDIQGKNCLFQLKIGDDYFTVVCAKSFTFNPVTDMKETTTVGSGFWKEFRPRKLSYTITFNGMVQVESLVTQEKIKTMFDYQIQFLPLNYRMIYQDNSGNVMNVNGTVYITSNLFDASPVNLVNGTTEMQGTGGIEVLDFIPDYINVTVQVTGDADAKTRFLLYNADGSVAYDTSTLLALLPTGGWLVQGESVVLVVQKGQYAWGVSTDDVGSVSNTFDLDITPAVHLNFTDADLSQNSLPTTYDFLTDKLAVFTIGPVAPPPACVPVAISGTPALPDGEVGAAWVYNFSLIGSQPFSISNVTKPSWMSINIVSGNIVTLSGTPDATGTDIDVSFDITNACGTVSFADTIDIAAAPPTTSTVNWSFDDEAAFPTARIYVNAVLVAETNVDDSGSFIVNPGDVVETQILSSILPTTDKTLLVVNTTDSITLYNDTDTSNQIFSFAAGSAKAYTISAAATS